MKAFAQSVAVLPALAVSVLGLAGSLTACTGEVAGNDRRPNMGGAGGGGAGGTPTVLPEGCEGPEIAMPKRLIRLSFPQVAASMRPVFGAEFAGKVLAGVMVPPTTERTFPPLGDTSEGSTYIDAKWQSADTMARLAGEQALATFSTLTGCGDAPTAECGQTFLTTVAEKAFRRPLVEREKTSVLQVFSEVTTAGGTVQQAVQTGVYAIYGSPQFLYRTEFGADKNTGPITPYELASQLSFFLTDAPPDADLLAAAAQNSLSTPEQITAQVDRLLALPGTKANLQDTVVAAYGIARVKSVVIDGLPADVWNSGVANSMFRETQLFINNVLWSGGLVSDLATSRKSFINKQLAPLYGVPEPTVLDADGFGPVDLPENRAGILTSLGFLTSRSRPDQQSVVGRGLSVNDAILCQQNPAFPEALADAIESVSEQQHDMSERQRAEYRGTTTPCKGCHTSFDPFGISLENFDVIGRFRTMDAEGRPIDASVTLPPLADSRSALNAVEMGKALAETGAFSSCVATKLLTYALAETGVNGTSCASQLIAEGFEKTDRTFGSLVRQVALSKSLTHRTGG